MWQNAPVGQKALTSYIARVARRWVRGRDRDASQRAALCNRHARLAFPLL
jgi:hypothetical protein